MLDAINLLVAPASKTLKRKAQFVAQNLRVAVVEKPDFGAADEAICGGVTKISH